MDFEKMLVSDFIQLATGEADLSIARAKCIAKGREVDPNETIEEAIFFNGVWAFKAELELRGNYLN